MLFCPFFGSEINSQHPLKSPSFGDLRPPDSSPGILTLPKLLPGQVMHASQVSGLYVQGFGSISATQVGTYKQTCEFRAVNLLKLQAPVDQYHLYQGIAMWL